MISPEMKPCVCGKCGLMFAVGTYDKKRIWAPGCPNFKAMVLTRKNDRRKVLADTKDGYLERRRESNRLYRERNAARVQESARLYREAHPIEIAEYKARKRLEAKLASGYDDVHEEQRPNAGKFCGECMDMPHARHIAGCRTCGGAYQDEVIERPTALRSSAGFA